MIESEIFEGIGNEVLLCGICFCVVVLCVSARLYTRLTGGVRDVFSSNAVLNVMNSNSTHAEFDVQPTDEEIDTYNAGTIDEPEEVFPEKLYAATSEPSESDQSTSLYLKEKPESLLRKRVASNCPKGHIILRLQYLDDRIRFVHAPGNMPVMYFKRKFFNDEILLHNKNVRLIFQGQELSNRETSNNTRSAPLPTHSVDPSLRRLCDYGVQNDSTIHCLISEVPAGRTHSSPVTRERSSSPRDPINETLDLDFGSGTILPMCGTVIGCSWVMCFTYFKYFSLIAIVALVLLSGLFLMAFWSSTNRIMATHRPSEPAAGDAVPGTPRTFNTNAT